MLTKIFPVFLTTLAGALYGAAIFVSNQSPAAPAQLTSYDSSVLLPVAFAATTSLPVVVETQESPETVVPEVPFYSQFADISAPKWRGVSCGVASLAMLIDYYSDAPVTADKLLQRGLAANAFLSDAGWIHAGLIALSHVYGLDGGSYSLRHLGPDAAFAEFTTVVAEGPVMASVHYTFEPTNPIPHLVVITGVKDGLVYYNDPAEAVGGGSLSVEKFQRAWKQRYIAIRPLAKSY